MGFGDGFGRRRFLEVEAILRHGVKKSPTNQRPEERSPQPRSASEFLTQAVVSHFALAGEGRFCHRRAEAGLFGQRLQQNCGPHGLSQPINTPRMHLP